MSEVATLHVDLDSAAVECGDVLAGSASWGPLDRAPRSVRVDLRYITAGAGTDDGRVVASADLGGGTEGTARFDLDVPFDGPITFAGRLIQVRWVVELVLDEAMRPDPSRHEPVTVLPRGGLAVWARQQAAPPSA